MKINVVKRQRFFFFDLKLELVIIVVKKPMKKNMILFTIFFLGLFLVGYLMIKSHQLDIPRLI